MIQYVPFVASGPLGQAQALAERAAAQATAWQQRYARTVLYGPATTSNVIVRYNDQITYVYTLTLCVEIAGDQAAPWGDPAEPPEWKALAPAPPVPLAAPADTAEGVEAARLAARGLPAPTPPTLPTPIHAVRPGGTVTDKQLKAIYAIGRAMHRWTEAQTDAFVQDTFQCRPSELSKTEASQCIDRIRAVAA